VRRGEQPQRVDVGGPVAADAPVQAAGRAAGVPRPQRAEHVTAHDRRAGPHRGGDGLVGRPQPVGVLHGHHTAAGERAGEDDHTRRGGEHGRARGGGQVHAAVPGPEPVRRRHERPHDDRGGRAQRPGVRGTRDHGPKRPRPRRRGEPEVRGEPEHQGDDGRTRRAPRPSAGVRRPVHAAMLAGATQRGEAPRGPVDGPVRLWTTGGPPGCGAGGGRAGAYARPRIPSCGVTSRVRVSRRVRPRSARGTVSGRSRGSRSVGSSSAGCGQRVRAPTRRQGGAAGRRPATTERAARRRPRRTHER
jgi:hypothetical protein